MKTTKKKDNPKFNKYFRIKCLESLGSWLWRIATSNYF